MKFLRERSIKPMARRSFVKGLTAIGGTLLSTATGTLLSTAAYASSPQEEIPKKFVFRTHPSTAKELVAELQAELQVIDEQIRQHPYLLALQKKQISLEALKAFPGHEYHTVQSDLRSMAHLVQRFGHDPLAGPFLNGVLQGEMTGLANIIRMGEKLGMHEADLQGYAVTPAGFTYPTYMAWEALYGSAASVVCGLLVNFAAWGHNCGVMSAALQEQYGFTSAETAFLDGFATLPPFDEAALPIIQAGLKQGVTPAAIKRTARLLQAYEKLFWDSLAQLADAG